MFRNVVKEKDLRDFELAHVHAALVLALFALCADAMHHQDLLL